MSCPDHDDGPEEERRWRQVDTAIPTWDEATDARERAASRTQEVPWRGKKRQRTVKLTEAPVLMAVIARPDLSYREIADLYGISVEQVRHAARQAGVRRARGRKRVRV
ncbi:MAG: hypothetical protein ACRDH9_09295 [Actinomycetota bacterium]